MTTKPQEIDRSIPPIEVDSEVTYNEALPPIILQSLPDKLAIYKPDVITEAISVELKIIEKLEKDIQNLACKVADKKAAIKKCQEVIKTLRKAKTQKES